MATAAAASRPGACGPGCLGSSPPPNPHATAAISRSGSNEHITCPGCKKSYTSIASIMQLVASRHPSPGEEARGRARGRAHGRGRAGAWAGAGAAGRCPAVRGAGGGGGGPVTIRAGGWEGRVLGGVGGWTPHDRRKMMRWDDGWDAEPRRASKPYGKPWKLMLAPRKLLQETQESRDLARKTS
jgi:hypothetical protein